MTKTENEPIRQLPDKNGRIFERCYQSSSYVFVSTDICTTAIFDRLVYLFDSEGFSWLKPLQTSTSRKLFIGRLSRESNHLPDVIFKKSRFEGYFSDPKYYQPGNVANEIRLNFLLDIIIQKQIKSGELLPPDGFNSLSVHLEQPLGMLVDIQNKSKYSVFLYEDGFDLGEILQYTDPPMQGAINYNQQDWKVFCGIKDVLERIAQVSLTEGLTLQDYDVHQVLYRVNTNTNSLKLILIDSERFRLNEKLIDNELQLSLV